MKKSNILYDLRGYLLLWGSQSLSELGTAMTSYALTIWVYAQKGTASSLTMLTLCSFLPTIFLRFIGGALADRWNKKRILLIADLAAACGTLTILVLHSLSLLEIWHLYVINALLSCMNAVQNPASFAAATALVPREHFTRIGGLQGFAGSAISILAPALGGLVLSAWGLNVVLLCDLVSFAFAFVTLLMWIHIPEADKAAPGQCQSFLQGCLEGVRYLKAHTGLLHLTLFMAAVNFLAKLGNDGMLSPFVLGRTDGDQQVLGWVQSAVAAGLLAGSVLVTLMKPIRRKTRVVFLGCAGIFAGNIVQSLTDAPVIWCAAAFGTYLIAAVMNANLTAVMRESIPPQMQGRVFSARDTLQNCTIPLGLLLGGALADRVLEPYMAAASPIQGMLSMLFGTGGGAGTAVLFFCVGAMGVGLSLAQLRDPACKSLDR